ncbi:MAG: N-acetylneuraminate synthase [Bacteroidia bacterium]|nr:N-acetylneuraminate synthase [Bacteroidia bacterium]
MNETVQLGKREVGKGFPCFFIAEIGINHNGSVDIAKKLIDVAMSAGCEAVKFQKRTVDVVYTQDELAKPRETPFGTTNGELKYALEFGDKEYDAIDAYCAEKNILWTASCWDEQSVDFISRYDPAFYKIASASLTDSELLRCHLDKGKPILLSTGMSSLEEIDKAVDVLDKEKLVLLHTTSTYPVALEEMNLTAIKTLSKRYDVPVGYSGHEVGIATSIAAANLGACVVERHITLDRSMWGSDQAASLEPQGLRRLIRDVRAIETAMGDGEKIVYPSELPIRAKLRRKNS